MGSDSQDSVQGGREAAPVGMPVGPVSVARWFYRVDARKSGPVEVAKLCEMLADGALPGTTSVWREGMPEWVPAEQVPEFVPSVAAGRVAKSSSTFRGTGGRSRATVLAIAALAALPVAWLCTSWLMLGMSSARINGVVTVDSKPVTGGSVILAPVDETKKAAPGRPGVAMVGADGGFSMLLSPGSDGLAKRFWVRYSPPVLPVMSEAEALKAVPPYVGLVPKVAQVEVAPGTARIDVELVRATSR